MGKIFEKLTGKKPNEKYLIIELYENGECTITEGGFTTNDIIAFLDTIKLQYQLEVIKEQF